MKQNQKDIEESESWRPVEVVEPAELTNPFIFALPHSGRRYPQDLLRNSRLDRHNLRQSEDAYVDLLFASAPRYGSSFLRARFPRAYIDVNRSQHELDPRMFADTLPKTADIRSSRVLAGLGVIPRVVADGHDIYERKLNYLDARRRIASCYEPYHNALTEQISNARAAYGCAVLIDCHSMPSAGGAPFRAGEPRIDFVLGDRFGSACASGLTSLVEQTLVKMGYRVARNAPYAGGYVAATYGRPSEAVHVLQIEINRGLYLDEAKITRTRGFETLREMMTVLIDQITKIEPTSLRPAQAAE